MPQNLQVNHQWGELEPNYEPGSAQEFVTQLSKILVSSLSGTYNTFNFGNAVPSVEDQDSPWFRTTATGEFDKIYSYSSTYGKWVSPHNIPASDGRRWLFSGASSAVDTLDGGTAGVASATAGPFWEIDTTFAYRMPVGVGTLPNSGTVLAVGDTGGADQHLLTAAEGAMDADHKHTTGRMSSDSGDTGDDGLFLTGSSTSTGAGRGVLGDGSGVSRADIEDRTGEYLVTSSVIGASTSWSKHNNMPPYKAVYFIKRTVREFHSI